MTGLARFSRRIATFAETEQQVSAHYAAVFLAMYGVAAIGRGSFAGMVDEMLETST
ncbi:hypothetical protein ACFVAO_11920 [Streptomyces californicus]|uniref:hypothetical protein n=1 Tax=Streptomyces californicus TaxID=67351 RepID=UPI0036A768EC